MPRDDKATAHATPPTSLTLDMADFLLSTSTAPILLQLQRQTLSPEYTLQILTELRKEFTPNQAAALLRLAQLRQKARRKFPAAEHMFFTAESLEQATAWDVALHRAQAIHANAPPGTILDLGCGIGGDTIALAHFRPVIAYERDPLRLRFAQANAQALAVAEQIDFRGDDWTAEMREHRLPPASAAFVDPARRAEGKRIFSLHQIEPPLAALLELQRQIPRLAVKVMPGVQDEELPAGCSVEFVSHEGTCKEGVLWLGEWEMGWWGDGEKGRRWASVFAQEKWLEMAASGQAAPVGVVDAGQFLYEPDPAVIRAGALVELCAMLDAHLFDDQIAYLVSAVQQLDNPFCRCFQIDEIHPFSLKLLNQRLQALQIGQVELKKRGFPEEPEHLRPRLKLTPGGRDAVIFFTRRGDERILLIGRRMA